MRACTRRLNQPLAYNASQTDRPKMFINLAVTAFLIVIQEIMLRQAMRKSACGH